MTVGAGGVEYENRVLRALKPQIKLLPNIEIKQGTSTAAFAANEPDLQLVIFGTPVNIEIKQGEKIAFVGQIGSGKSTLVKIIMGFQQLKMGDITICGNSINKIANKDLIDNIFYIPQKPKLFNRTLYENIVYGIKKPPSKEEILNILSDLDLDDIKTEFTDRMDLKTGIEGNKLSGGQRQIVWLLRAFFRVSRILIMDEPTASLDPVNKQKMIHVIKKLTIGKTLIIVSHDHIDDAFRKIEFKEGKLVSSSYF